MHFILKCILLSSISLIIDWQKWHFNQPFCKTFDDYFSYFECFNRIVDGFKLVCFIFIREINAWSFIQSDLHFVLRLLISASWWKYNQINCRVCIIITPYYPSTECVQWYLNSFGGFMHRNIARMWPAFLKISAW